MAAESQVKAKVIYDTSQMQEGVQETVDGLKEMASQATVTSETMMTKSQAMAKAAQDAAATVTESDLKIAEATKVATQAKAAQAKAMRDVKNGAGEEADAIILLAVAQGNARAAALQLAAAQEQIVVSSHAAVSGVQATSAAIRSLEGNAGIRAVENFVAKTLGLGPLLQAVFPLIGAAAFATILIEGGEKLVELEQKGKHAGEEIANSFENMDEKLQASNDELELQNSKLADSIAKLEGHPSNGLQTALLEAKVAADKLQESLAADVRELQKLLKDNSVSEFESILANVGNTKSVFKDVDDSSKALEKQTAKAHDLLDQQLLAAQEAHAKALSESKGNQTQQLAADDAFHAAQVTANKTYYGSVADMAAQFARDRRKTATDLSVVQTATKEDLTPSRSAEEDAAVVGDRLQRRAQLSASNFSLESKKGELEGDKGSKGDDDKASEKRFKQMEADLAQLKTEAPVTAQAEFDYWDARRSAFTVGSAQYNAIVEKQASIAEAGAKRAHELIAKFKIEQQRDDHGDDAGKDKADAAVAKMDARLQQQAADALRTGQSWDALNSAVAKGAQIQASIREAMQESQLHLLESVGGIGALAAAQENARIHTDEHTRALKALEEELSKLEKIASSPKKDPLTGKPVADPQLDTKIQSVKNQISQEKGGAAVQGQQDQAAVGAAVAKPYLNAFNDINNGWLKVQRDLIQGNKNITRDFAQMGLQLVQTMAANFERMLVSQVQMEVRRLAVHAATTASSTTIDATGAAVSVQISAQAALKKQAHSAAVAAGKAWSALADIPIVGPVLGAVAAGVVYAGVMALAAFEQGGIVGGAPGMAVPILAHAGERVLSPSQTNKFESMVNNNSTSSGNSGDMHLHMGGTHNYSHGGGDFKSQLKQHRMELAKTVKSLHREGHLKFKGVAA